MADESEDCIGSLLASVSLPFFFIHSLRGQFSPANSNLFYIIIDILIFGGFLVYYHILSTFVFGYAETIVFVDDIRDMYYIFFFDRELSSL